MKLKITFKDPDGVTDCVRDALNANRPEGLTDAEWETVREEREGDLDLSPFVEYKEYITVEIDTEKKTAVVVPFK